MKQKIQQIVFRLGIPGCLAIAVTILGLVLRIEHAHTFDGPGRGSDYAAHVAGVRWMGEHMVPFDFTKQVPWSIGYQPPLWYMVGSLILDWTNNERAIAYLAVVGWVVRQIVLARVLAEAVPGRRWSALAALAINAVLPLAVLTDGKVNPEGMHTTLFMIAVYFLWRMERQDLRPEGISLVTATLLGVFSGLAVLTKGTAGVLPLATAILLCWQSIRSWKTGRWTTIWRRQLRPAIVAGISWCVIAGWWCGPNLVKYHHPFPHVWDQEGPEIHPELATPVFYRRPLGWALPFEWKEYIALPIIQSPTKPRPNLWAVLVSGTWSDFYDRGFCRLTGGGTVSGTWSGYPVSRRCVDLFSHLVEVGLVLTAGSLAALWLVVGMHLRGDGRRGSLVIPMVIVLGVAFSSFFALVYPYDNAAVLNPRYLLPESGWIAACLGIALGQFESQRWKRRAAHGLMLLGIGIVAILVTIERFGK